MTKRLGTTYSSKEKNKVKRNSRFFNKNELFKSISYLCPAARELPTPRPNRLTLLRARLKSLCLLRLRPRRPFLTNPSSPNLRLLCLSGTSGWSGLNGLPRSMRTIGGGWPPNAPTTSTGLRGGWLRRYCRCSMRAKPRSCSIPRRSSRCST